MIRAGSMRHVVMIQKPIYGTSASGEAVITYQDVAEVRAGINPVTGNESFISAEKLNEVTHKIEMRFRELKPDNILVFNNRIFDIEQILNFNERNINLIILAKERLNVLD